MNHNASVVGNSGPKRYNMGIPQDNIDFYWALRAVTLLCALGAMLMLMACPLSAQVLQVQFQDYSQAVQTGFDQASIGGGGTYKYSFTPAYNGVNYTLNLQATASPNYVAGGIGYAPTMPGPFDTFYETYIDTYATDLRFNVGGLSPYTTYAVTFQSFQQYGGSNETDYLRNFSSLTDPTIGTYLGTYTTKEGSGTTGNYPTSLTPSTGGGWGTVNATTDGTGNLYVGLSQYNSSGAMTGGTLLLANGMEIGFVGPPSFMGSGNFETTDTGTTLTSKINALRSAGVACCRVALLPADYYPGGTAGVSAATQTLVNALVAQGITPYLHFEYYQNEYGWGPGPILSYNWGAIGTAFATTFGTNVLHYAAVNEPDLAIDTGGSTAVIPPADYATALGDLATGIHSVVPSAKVVPGGYGGPATYHDWTCQGYPAALNAAGLFSSGALDGIDLHIYWDNGQYTPITTPSVSSQQGQFLNVKQTEGLGDVNCYCTEFNSDSVGSPYLMTLAWSVLTCTKNDNQTPNTKVAFPFSIVENTNGYGLYSSYPPWIPNANGTVIQRIAQLTSGLQFVPGTLSQAGCTMSGSKRKLYVIQNITNWAIPVSSNYTCNNIPSTSKHLLRYDYTGTLQETVTIPLKTTSYTFTDIPGVTANCPYGQTTMIVATP